MKRLFALQAVFAVLLLSLVSVWASRVLERHSGARIALGRSARTGLKDDTLRYLSGLRGRVSLSYFVSARDAMPSVLKRVEDAVREVLEAFKAAAPERVDFRVLDPGLDTARGAAYASGKSASPEKVRKVLLDESSEEAIWSSLALAHDQHPDALIQGITAADLPYLEDWILENLKAAANPIQAVIAVSAPIRGYNTVRESLQSFERDKPNPRVISIDLDSDPRIPPEADWLLWIEPGRATREHVAELERFLSTGRSAIIAGSTYSVDYLPRDGGKIGYRILPSPCDWKTLLQPFGLGLTPLLVLDKNHEAISWHGPDGSLRKVDAPFHLRILPSLFDTRSLLGPNAGALLVSSVSPIQMDPRAALAAGRKVEVVATTSEHVRVLDLPGWELDDALLEGAQPVPKQPWMVILKPADHWKGDLIVAGSPVLFHDDPYAQGGNANQVFLRTLARTYTHPPRLARIRVPRPGPPSVPPLSLASRVAWRGATVLLVPACLMALALRVVKTGRRGPLRLPRGKPALVGAAAFAVILVMLRLSRGLELPALDLTEDRIHTASPLTSRLLEDCREGLSVELLLSDRLHMPASLKGLEARILATLRGLGLRPRIVRPEDLAREEQAKLIAAGIRPFDVETIEGDAPRTTRVWSALRLERSGKTEVLPELDPRAAEHLEFLLAAAAKRLQGSPAPIVGVLSDLPRLSPAEAHTDYQQKGYTAPVGSDVYSFAKRLLAQHGYEIVYINPESPVFPPKMDLLVWLQPRFPQRVYPQLTKYLAEGGKAFIAMQHYNVQQQQYRGTGFKTVYWPQPQFHGFNDYLKLIGVRQVGDKQGEQAGEVLLDRSHANLILDTQVNRSAFREHDPQQVSRPFLIRAAGDGLSSTSVITHKLGELLFIWGSRFTAEEGQLSKLGIARTVLATTSSRSWSYAWSGGYIPEEGFIEPRESPLGRQPLVLLLEGKLPAVEIKKDESGRETLAEADAPGPSAAPGKLLLAGCSEMFKNAHLYLPEYQHDQFLLNAVAFLAHGHELAEVEARRRVPKSFPFQPAEAKLEWRIAAVGLAPLLFVLYGIAHWRWRKRPVPGGLRDP